MSKFIKHKLTFEEIRTLAYGSVIAGYTIIGGELLYPSVKLWVNNYTDARLLFSTDGTTNHFRLNQGESLVFDNLITPNTGVFAAGTKFYVKRDETPTTGVVDVISVYGA